jgi:hypothetical protein
MLGSFFKCAGNPCLRSRSDTLVAPAVNVLERIPSMLILVVNPLFGTPVSFHTFNEPNLMGTEHSMKRLDIVRQL